MILSSKVLSRRQTQPRQGKRLSPEEDVLILDNGDIDETLPADLWFQIRRQHAISGGGQHLPFG